jgi:hypothetical protein
MVEGLLDPMNYFTPTYALLRQAILDRKQVTCFYDGRRRECCPHAIGTKHGKTRVLMFQFGGESNSGLPAAGQWRCMDIAGMAQIAVRDGEWHTATSHLRPQTCIDHVDVDVRS